MAALATHSYTLQTLKYVLLISMAIGWACEIMAGRLAQADAMLRKGVRNGMPASGPLVGPAGHLARLCRRRMPS